MNHSAIVIITICTWVCADPLRSLTSLSKKAAHIFFLDEKVGLWKQVWPWEWAIWVGCRWFKLMTWTSLERAKWTHQTPFRFRQHVILSSHSTNLHRVSNCVSRPTLGVRDKKNMNSQHREVTGMYIKDYLPPYELNISMGSVLWEHRGWGTSKGQG